MKKKIFNLREDLRLTKTFANAGLPIMAKSDELSRDSAAQWLHCLCESKGLTIKPFDNIELDWAIQLHCLGESWDNLAIILRG